VRTSIRVSALAVLAIGCARAPTTAEAPLPFDPDKSRNVVKIYELVAEYPLPTWASLPPTASHFRRQQKGPEFLMEQIPEDEQFPAWTRIYTIYGRYAKGGQFDAFKTVSLREWSSACRDERFATQAILDAPSHWRGLIFCESTHDGPADGPAGHGWGEDVGSVTLMDLQHLSQTYVRIHHIWRGRRYDRADPASWPVAETEVQQMVGRFERIRLSYDAAGPQPK
jgi:hypothetical protein